MVRAIAVFCFLRSRPEVSSEGLGRLGGIFAWSEGLGDLEINPSLRNAAYPDIYGAKEEGNTTQADQGGCREAARSGNSWLAPPRPPIRSGTHVTRKRARESEHWQHGFARHHQYGHLSHCCTLVRLCCSDTLVTPPDFYHKGRAPGCVGTKPGLCAPSEETRRSIPRRVRAMNPFHHNLRHAQL